MGTVQWLGGVASVGSPQTEEEGHISANLSTVSPLHTNLQVANFQRCERACQPLYASCCTGTTVLFKILYCKIYNVFYIFCVCFLCTHYLCEKYYKPITVQYYIVDCVSWVPRLPLLDLGTNWTYEPTLGMGLVHM